MASERSGLWGSRRPGEGAEGGSGGPDLSPEVLTALLALGRVIWVMTACHDSRRRGARVISVQPCARAPLLVAVAMSKGHSIEPLIRDSRVFALCVVDEADRLAQRRFPEDDPGEEPGAEVDPFVGLAVRAGQHGVPLLTRGGLWLECEVVRHFDLEADAGIFVGHVVGGGVSGDGGGGSRAGGFGPDRKRLEPPVGQPDGGGGEAGGTGRET